MDCWVGYEAMHNYKLFQPQKSKLAVPNAFLEKFKFDQMNLPVASQACEHEVVWLDENIFRCRTKGADGAVAAIKKIQANSRELAEAAEDLRK